MRRWGCGYEQMDSLNVVVGTSIVVDILLEISFSYTSKQLCNWTIW